jgi:hypothetical protein
MWYHSNAKIFQDSMWYHGPSCTMWDWANDPANSHPSKQGTLPTTSLISKQVVPYQTRGGTCCPIGTTPKNRYLADSSMRIHISWKNPTVSTNPTHAQTTTSILTMVTSHHDGWNTNTLNTNTSQTQHHRYGKTCRTLMTAWLSITNQVWTQIQK